MHAGKYDAPYFGASRRVAPAGMGSTIAGGEWQHLVYFDGVPSAVALIFSRPVSGLMRYATGRQSRSLQQDIPSGERSPGVPIVRDRGHGGCRWRDDHREQNERRPHFLSLQGASAKI
jgi:hypothetical protein